MTNRHKSSSLSRWKANELALNLPSIVQEVFEWRAYTTYDDLFSVPSFGTRAALGSLEDHIYARLKL